MQADKMTMQIDVETTKTGVVYSLRSKKGTIIVECGDDRTIKVTGPKNIISSAIGGRGDENEKEAWFQDKDIKSASEAISNVLEIIRVLEK